MRTCLRQLRDDQVLLPLILVLSLSNFILFFSGYDNFDKIALMATISFSMSRGFGGHQENCIGIKWSSLLYIWCVVILVVLVVLQSCQVRYLYFIGATSISNK